MHPALKGRSMWFWFGCAVLALIGEAMTGTFYLLLFALGLAAGGVADMLNADVSAQIAAVAIVTALGLLVLRKTGVLKKREINAARNRDVNLDIGQTVDVPTWTVGDTADVWYRGARWQARLAAGSVRQPGVHRIIEVEGSTLIVEPSTRSNRT